MWRFSTNAQPVPQNKATSECGRKVDSGGRVWQHALNRSVIAGMRVWPSGRGRLFPLSFTLLLRPGSSSFRNGSHYTTKTKVTDAPFSSRMKSSDCHADALYSRFHSSRRFGEQTGDEAARLKRTHVMSGHFISHAQMPCSQKELMVVFAAKQKWHFQQAESFMRANNVRLQSDWLKTLQTTSLFCDNKLAMISASLPEARISALGNSSLTQDAIKER